MQCEQPKGCLTGDFKSEFPEPVDETIINQDTNMWTFPSAYFKHLSHKVGILRMQSACEAELRYELSEITRAMVRDTLTFTDYRRGKTVTEEDVQAAVDDLEQLYASCAADGRLGDSTFDFMKEELTVKDAVDITTKVKTQPYAPPPVAVTGASTFPVDGA